MVTSMAVTQIRSSGVAYRTVCSVSLITTASLFSLPAKCETPVFFDNGLSVGVGYGRIFFDGARLRSKIEEDVFKFFGGLRFGKLVGVKVSYFNIENASTALPFNIEVVDSSASLHFPVSEFVQFFLKGGAHYSGISFGEDDGQNVGFSGGLGASIVMSNTLTLRAEYEYFDDFGGIKDLQADQVTVGFSLDF